MNNHHIKNVVTFFIEAPVILKEPNKTQVEEQGDTELSCEISGNPIPTVTWTLNGEQLQNDTHVTTTSTYDFDFFFF